MEFSQMEPELRVVQYESKVKQLLKVVLDPNFAVTYDACLNSFLSHLSRKDDEGLGDALLNLPIFVKWVITLTQHWENIESILSLNTINFITKITSLLSQNEHRFNQMSSFNVYVRLCTVLRERSTDSSPTIKITYIKLLLSLLDHISGINWIISTGNWQDVLAYCLVVTSTTQVLQEGYNFLYNLLVKCSNYNKAFCIMVVETIMSTFNNLNVQNYETLREELTPSLRILSYIFVTFLQKNIMSRDYTLPKFFLIDYNLKQIIVSILNITGENKELFKDLNNIAILNHLFLLEIDLKTENVQRKQFQKLLAEVGKLIASNISKGFITNICHLCHLLQYYWNLMQPRLPNNEVLMFESQILLFQVLPSFMISYKECSLPTSDMICNYFREHFLTKVFKATCEEFVRLSYGYRKFLIREEVSLFDAAWEVTNYVMRTRKYYHRNTGVLAFQYYVYTLYDLHITMKENSEMIERFSNCTAYFIAVFDLITTFIKDFNITWKDSVESFCLTILMVDFISLRRWSSKIIIQAFKLIDLTIARYMSCNLALLIERSNELTAMYKLGQLLRTYLGDQEWEVRNSALKIIHTVSKIAVEMYLPFQDDIINFQFPSLILSIAMHDSEKQVRARAIKCLQEMIKVQHFWCLFFNKEGLSEKMIRIVYDTKEDTNVRSKAIKLLIGLCEYQSFPKLQNQINQAVLYASTKYYDWKVHKNTLKYWRKVIDHHLKKQGMIDERFPDYTFSRKIVILTEEKIRIRLLEVLEKLSKCGCLEVLVTLMQSRCDIQVLKKAVEITQFLKNILILYKIIDNNFFPSSSSLNTNNNVNANEYCGIITDNTENYYYSNIRLETDISISVKNFLFFIQRDLDKLVIERLSENQEHSLDSLLDDMLKCLNTEANALGWS